MASFDARLDNYVRRQASRWRIDGYEPDDLYQEARLAAWRAVMPGGTYDPTRGSLGGHVHAAISGHLQNAQRTAHAAKRSGNVTSLDALIIDQAHGDQLALFDITPDPRSRVADVVELRSDLVAMARVVADLPPRQREAHELYVSEEPMSRAQQSAADVARRKLRAALAENAA